MKLVSSSIGYCSCNLCFKIVSILFFFQLFNDLRVVYCRSEGGR
ncbi:hypothetical protein HanXRQr2_Chr14g0625961 [Helianthus annuus]|uniref:Uncharacterized protein n=1 Tax=Helianthus annuus TaxID=4232 RepID=A0A9K3E638_HELAN|nr:hypothetical protein HanXRQr2_Chr14g0625961 [Helianthus annuus]